VREREREYVSSLSSMQLSSLPYPILTPSYPTPPLLLLILLHPPPTHTHTHSHAQGGKGDYVFVRRMDDQVKIDGFRIELAEIETVFAKHPLVGKAGVLLLHSERYCY
jgi:acyl-CoA synthetase (AMP-forming)/AMP-acid ligase II